MWCFFIIIQNNNKDYIGLKYNMSLQFTYRIGPNNRTYTPTLKNIPCIPDNNDYVGTTAITPKPNAAFGHSHL